MPSLATRLAGVIGGLTLIATTALSAPAALADTAAPSSPTKVVAATAKASELDKLMAGVRRHLVTRDGKRLFDRKSAVRAGESAAVLKAGAKYNALANSPGSSQAGKASASGYRTSDGPVTSAASYGGVAVWGNWCGPGHSGPDAPVDTLDALCMQHDLCCANSQYFDCDCDAELRAGIRREFSGMRAGEKVAAAAILLWFSLAPCRE